MPSSRGAWVTSLPNSHFQIDERNNVRSLLVSLFVCPPVFIIATVVVVMEVRVDVSILAIILNILLTGLVGPSLILQRRHRDFAYDSVENFRKNDQERFDQLHLSFVIHRELVKGLDNDRKLVRCSMSDGRLVVVPSRNDGLQHLYVSRE